jgi:hypothetical protein
MTAPRRQLRIQMINARTRMIIILILFVTAQLIGPVLLIRFFKWQGILGAFAFTAALH